MEQSKLLLTVKEAVEACGLSRSYLYLQIAEGRLRPAYFGRAVRIHRDELDRWIAAHRSEARDD